ncbi:hypothetical protein ES703_10877 [subsurface metagenome]
METLEAIKKRASLKTHVSARDVEPEKITKILDAARLAPSARNRQPWRFVVVTDKEVIRTLVSRAFGEMNLVLKEAPVIIIACADPGDAVFDVGLAVENMILAATDLGLVTHVMSGPDGDEIKRILGIPGEVRFVIATPLAYPAEGSYDEAARERLSQRTRKELQEVAYTNAWGKPF